MKALLGLLLAALPLSGQSWLEQVDVPLAHLLGAKGQGTTIAVFGGGAGPHPDLKPYECLNLSGGSCLDTDPSGHETFTLWEAMQVAPLAKFVSYKVLNEIGAFDQLLMAQAINDFRLKPGFKVASISLGADFWTISLCQAIQQFVNQGNAVVVSAGNTGFIMLYPAPCGGSVAVINAAGDGSKWPTSAYQPPAGHDPLMIVACPGVGIVGPVPGGGWTTKTGASMAAPVCAGIVALVGQSALLCQTASAPKPQTGCGVPSASRATAAARGGVAFSGDTVRNYLAPTMDSTAAVCLPSCQVNVEGPGITLLPNNGYWVRWLATSGASIVRIRKP